MHIDTGQNFDEVIAYRDRDGGAAWTSAGRGAAFRTTSTPVGLTRSIDGAPRNRLQTISLLRGISEHQFGAVFGGARRDEEKARAKERVFSFRDEFGQWDPRNQRPELWSLYNGRHRKGENIRVFPLSNWTELDIWSYIERESIELPALYYAHRRTVVERDGMLLAVNRFIEPQAGRDAVRGNRPLPHRRRRHLHRLCGVGGRDRRRRRRGGCSRPPDRTRSHPRRRPDLRSWNGRPQERGLLLMSELLRIATAGSVDDGKSTLIGRLLFDSKAIFEDQLDAVSATSKARGSGGARPFTASPTACGPSGNRASPSMSPIGTSRRPSESSSSPTRRATSSTPATW